MKNQTTTTEYKHRKLLEDLQQLQIVKVVQKDKVIIEDLIRILLAVILLIAMLPVFIIKQLSQVLIKIWYWTNEKLVGHLFQLKN